MPSLLHSSENPENPLAVARWLGRRAPPHAKEEAKQGVSPQPKLFGLKGGLVFQPQRERQVLRADAVPEWSKFGYGWLT